MIAICLCVVGRSATGATLQGYGEIERCWYNNHSLSGVKWSAVCDDVVIGGDYLCAKDAGKTGDASDSLTPAQEGDVTYCWCRMTVPYVGLYVRKVSAMPLEYNYCNGWFGCGVECHRLWIHDLCDSDGTNDDGDCEVEKGIGFADATEQEKYLNFLFATEMPTQAVCEIGISRLRLSTGDSFQLYAEKYTEPSLVVRYNNQLYYGNLEQGGGKLNIKYNGVLYHVTE